MTEPEQLPGRPISRLLKVAVSAGIESAVRLHIARGDDLEGRDEAGLTPLMIAASRNRVSICRILLQAGANPRAVDSNGDDALSIARGLGLSEAAAVISEGLATVAPSDVRSGERSQIARDLAGEVVDVSTPLVSTVLQHRGVGSDLDSTDASLDFRPAVNAQGTRYACAPARIVTPTHEVSPLTELSLEDWEPVDPPQRPPDDAALMQAETERRRRIDAHSPIDRSARWDDLDVFLPERARPVAKSYDQERRQSLRGLILRALREGSVPRVAIEDALSERGDGENRDEQAELAFEFLLGDLGADIDERLEFRSTSANEDFEVPISMDESEAEESEVDAALLHYDQMRSGSNDPLVIYYRSAARHALLGADQEVWFAKQMEQAVDSALDALARWPEGIRRFIDSVARARADASVVCKIVATPTTAADELELASESARPNDAVDEDDPTGPSAGQGVNELVEGVDGLPDDDPIEVFERILGIEVEPLSAQASSALREQLALLRFRRPFLISLADSARDVDRHVSCAEYSRAIAKLLECRSRMAEANLRLVLDLARRQLSSGAALEDLVQDGNIGLLSAVDRFDWRRGFRFSTMATWWIKQSMTRGIADKLLAIRLPVHIWERVSRARRQTESSERRTGRRTTVAEQAALCGLSITRFETAARSFSDPVSIEQAELDGELEQDASNNPFEIVAAKEQAQVLDDALGGLRRKDAETLRMRFGFGVPEDRTLDQIGQVLDVTRERVRQIEAKALRKLTSKSSCEFIAKALGFTRDATKPNSSEPPLVTDDGEAREDAENRDADAHPAYLEEIGHAERNMLGSPGAAEAEADGTQYLVETARELGIPVAVEGEGTGQRYVFGILQATSGKERNLVRSLVELGYALRPGEGYCK